MGEFFLNELVSAEGVGYGVNTLTAILMGIGVVFAGLVGLIIVCSITGAICKAVIKESPQASAPALQQELAHTDEIPERGKFVAAVSAAIAEASGTDAAGIRIVKIEKK